MVALTPLRIFLLAFVYWFSNLSWGYQFMWMRPVWLGVLAGAILGDVATGTKIGAIIQPMFLAFTGAGGTRVWDPQAGTIMACAVVMSSGLPLEQGLTIAVPISLLLVQLSTLRRILFAWNASMADKAALKGNDKAIIFWGSYATWLMKIPLFFIPMYLGISLGAEFIGQVLAGLPQWAINSLTAVGGMLPALGMAMTIRVISRPNFWPFFLGGFFLVQYTKVSGLFLAFIGAFFAFIYFLILQATEKEEQLDMSAAGDAALDENTKRVLTKKDITRHMVRWLFWIEQSNSFARLQSIPYCMAFVPILKKLYGNDPEAYSQALTRHLMFFNTQGIFGCLIVGITIAMEEQRALGMPIGVEAITGVKAGLMGPFAGIGDTIFGSTLNPMLIILIALPMASQGNPLGPILCFFLTPMIAWSAGYYFIHSGYRMGTRAAIDVLQGSRINTFISVASVLGLFMIGGMSAQMVKVTTPIFVPTSGTPVQIQGDVLDKIAPGILPLGLILLVFRYLQKGGTMMKAALILTAVGIGLGAVGIFGGGGLVFKAYVAPA
jgi:mannose/fructose/N-acetylgalactosamine-specific phosphotransferase system component IID/mannose/fructose/N-acetylgalactosamine-specific phosphotransferase system component IIC